MLDGTGNPWFAADVGIRGDRIAKIGDLRGARAARELEARGKFVTPGFIALPEHIDRGILQGRGRVENYLSQGFTTAVINADGLEGGSWPLRVQRDALRRLGQALNLAPMVAHGTVRGLAMARTPEQVMRPASAAELRQMQALVRQGMDEGAFGMSTGLEYQPVRYATTDELVVLAETGGRTADLHQHALVRRLRRNRHARAALGAGPGGSAGHEHERRLSAGGLQRRARQHGARDPRSGASRDDGGGRALRDRAAGRGGGSPRHRLPRAGVGRQELGSRRAREGTLALRHGALARTQRLSGDPRGRRLDDEGRRHGRHRGLDAPRLERGGPRPRNGRHGHLQAFTHPGT